MSKDPMTKEVQISNDERTRSFIRTSSFLRTWVFRPLSFIMNPLRHRGNAMRYPGAQTKLHREAPAKQLTQKLLRQAQLLRPQGG